jgi:hypothetical protein
MFANLMPSIEFQSGCGGGDPKAQKKKLGGSPILETGLCVPFLNRRSIKVKQKIISNLNNGIRRSLNETPMTTSQLHDFC